MTNFEKMAGDIPICKLIRHGHWHLRHGMAALRVRGGGVVGMSTEGSDDNERQVPMLLQPWFPNHNQSKLAASVRRSESLGAMPSPTHERRVADNVGEARYDSCPLGAASAGTDVPLEGSG
jgi:hypothetical protein